MKTLRQKMFKIIYPDGRVIYPFDKVLNDPELIALEKEMDAIFEEQQKEKMQLSKTEAN